MERPPAGVGGEPATCKTAVSITVASAKEEHDSHPLTLRHLRAYDPANAQRTNLSRMPSFELMHQPPMSHVSATNVYEEFTAARQLGANSFRTGPIPYSY